jgi:hypothetical protein
MMKNVNPNRGYTFDAITDQWFAIGKDKDCRDIQKEFGPDELCLNCNKKVVFATSLLNHQYWRTKESERHHEARLVCLNKVYPRTPEIDQYRPIIVESPVIKFWEGLITSSLRKWMQHHMEKSQFGFAPGRSIEDCRLDLFQQLGICRNSNEQRFLLFVDLTSAYDLVDRRLLVERIRETNALSEDQINILKWLMSNQRIKLGKHVEICTNGVPQGSTSAPGLWNVYCDSLIRRIRAVNLDRVTVRAYADDICVIATSLFWLGKAIDEIEKWCK